MDEARFDAGSDREVGPLCVVETIRVVDSEELRARQLAAVVRLLRWAYELGRPQTTSQGSYGSGDHYVTACLPRADCQLASPAVAASTLTGRATDRSRAWERHPGAGNTLETTM